MSFVFVKRKYGGTKVGKAIAITEDNKEAIKKETGVEVTIEANGHAVVPHDGGYKLAKVGDYFISYTSTEGKSDSDIVDAKEYTSFFEAVSSLKKPDPAGRVRAAGFKFVSSPEQAPPAPPPPSVNVEFAHTQSTINASLDEANNDTGHTFTLGTITYTGEATGNFQIEFKATPLNTYKLKLKTNTIAKGNNVQVEAILQRARKDQKAQVTHTCPVVLTIEGKKFEFNIEIDIAQDND